MRFRWWHGFWDAIFLDVPYTLDSLWRFTEFDANRSGRLSLDTGAFPLRSLARSPVGVLFAFVVVLSCFGPTLDSLCVAVGARAWGITREAFGAVLFVLSVRVLVAAFGRGRRTLASRYKKLERPPAARLAASRKVGAYAVLITGALAFVALPILLALYQFKAGRDLVACEPGPSAARLAAGAQLLVAAACLAAGAWALGSQRVASSFKRFLLLSAVLAVTAISLAGVAWQEARILHLSGALGVTEAAGGPYLHVFALALLALLVPIALARYLAYLCFGIWRPNVPIDLQAQLAKVELLTNHRPDPGLTTLRRWAAFMNGVIYHPLHLLLLPSFAALFSPTKYMWLLTALLAVVSVLLVMWGSLSARWQVFMSVIERSFLSGVPLVISIAAIGVGFARLMEVQYVSTVLDSTPFGFLFVVVIMAYTASWFVEYWTNRWAGERLLAVLGTPDTTATFVPYGLGSFVTKADGTLGPDEKLRKSGVVIALHGTGRFAVHGWYWEVVGRKQRVAKAGFTTYGFGELFRALGHEDHAENVARRIRLYFASFNTVLALALVGVLAAAGSRNSPLDQLSSATARTYVSDGSVDLAQLLADQASAGRPALVVAASGGGTRAAIYTATALHGLAQLGRSRDVVLVSGVSGGGVASAYFADYLAGVRDYDKAAWQKYQSAMAEPFIQDVLEGSTELRIAGNAPLGELLKESFVRRLFGGAADPAAQDTFAAVQKVGLVLNTTITGHPRQISRILNERVGGGANESCEDSTRPYASLSGGRLVFTNLANVSAFPTADQARVPDAEFHYTVVRDQGVPLAAASALTANFPPVFPNARVSLETADGASCHESYFVTDGGATENLGLISALYALRGALKEARERGLAVPPIHLIVIEASALTYDYSQDRGVGAATGGGKDRLAGGLTQELISSIDAGLDGRAPQMQVHYLALPIPFRSRGGLGTHWMFAESVRVSNPRIAEPRSRWSQFWRQRGGEIHYAILDQQQIMATWDALFDPNGGFCDREHADLVSQWICGRGGATPVLPDLQVEEWDRTIKQLAATAKVTEN